MEEKNNLSWLALLFFVFVHGKMREEDHCCVMMGTRPDTRPSVADGWAGASNLNPYIKSPTHMLKKHLKHSFPHFSTRVHRPTDRPTDGAAIELRARN